MIKTINFSRKTKVILAIVLVFASLAGPIISNTNKTTAAPFTRVYVRYDRLTASTATTGRVCATPSATALAGTEGKVIIQFPETTGTAVTVSTTLTNWSVNTTFESGFTATPWPGIGQATAASNTAGTKSVTFPSGDLTSSSTLYCFNWTNSAALTTGTAGGTVNTFGYVETQTGANAQIDKSYWGVTIINNDQVSVSAAVVPYFTLGLSGNSDALGNLSSATTTSSTGINVTVNTNAFNGWIVWAKSANNSGGNKGSLYSPTATHHITSSTALNAASHTLTPGTPDYGLGVETITQGSGAGTATADTAFESIGTTKIGTLDFAFFRPIVTSTGTAINAVIPTKMRAMVSNATPAANDYADTITYVGAGQF